MESISECLTKTSTKERRLSEVDIDFINRKKKEDMTAGQGLRLGDSIIITNENNDGSIKDEIHLLVEKDSHLVIKSGKYTKTYNFSLGSTDQRKGFNLKEIEGSTRLPDGSMYRKNLYEIIKNDTGVDLEHLAPGLIDLGAKPLRIERGGSVAWNNEADTAEVIFDKNKKIQCRNGVTYSMSTQKQPLPEKYELLEIYHLHPGDGESILDPSSDDVLSMLHFKVPSTIYAEYPGGGFIGKEYKFKKDKSNEKAKNEIEKIDHDFMKDKNTQTYLKKCKLFVNEYFDTKLNTLK